MFEQKTNHAKNLDCIENVEQINDLAAETIAGGNFVIRTKTSKEGAWTYTNADANTHFMPIENTNADWIEIQVYNPETSWRYFDISIHSEEDRGRYGWTHGSGFGAYGEDWSSSTVVHDEIAQYGLKGKEIYLDFRKKGRWF